MTSTADDRMPPSGDEGERHGPLDALLASVGLRRKSRDDGRENHGPAHAGSDLVDQAEAFQNLRVSDVATPRADVMAVELSSPFEAVVAAFAESEHSRLP